MKLPKSLKRFGKLIKEFEYLTIYDAPLRYNIYVKDGYSFQDLIDGQDGRPCQQFYNAETVREAVERLRAVKPCDCEACKRAHNGKCIVGNF